MKIAVLGSGSIGGSLGVLWGRAGHSVVFASRHPENLQDLVEQAGGNAASASVDEAIDAAPIVLDALPFAASLKLPTSRLAGKTVISASNYYPGRDGKISLDGLSETEALACALRQSTLTKAFNMMPAQRMQERVSGNPERELVIFFAGDDPSAKQATSTLIADAKFIPLDVGGLADGAAFQTGGPLYGAQVSLNEARALLY